MEPFCSLKKIIKKDGKEVVVCDDIRSYLLEELQRIQDEEGYISDNNMQAIAKKFEIHPVEVYSVVTFYSFLYTEKKGKYIIRVCNGASCTMKGSPDLLKALQDKLGIEPGQTSKDGKYSLETTSCIGMCDKSPAIMVNDELIGPLDIKDIDKILKDIDKG